MCLRIARKSCLSINASIHRYTIKCRIPNCLHPQVAQRRSLHRSRASTRQEMLHPEAKSNERRFDSIKE